MGDRLVWVGTGKEELQRWDHERLFKGAASRATKTWMLQTAGAMEFSTIRRIPGNHCLLLFESKGLLEGIQNGFALFFFKSTVNLSSVNLVRLEKDGFPAHRGVYCAACGNSNSNGNSNGSGSEGDADVTVKKQNGKLNEGENEFVCFFGRQ